MIIQLLLTPIFFLLRTLLDNLPVLPGIPDFLTSLVQIISYGLVIFPGDVWIMLITVIIFWRTALPSWAIIEWIYKKIPGVD